MSILRVMFAFIAFTSLSACTAIAVTGAVVGAATAVAVEVVEVPFEVAGGIHNVMIDDDDDEEENEEED